MSVGYEQALRYWAKNRFFPDLSDEDRVTVHASKGYAYSSLTYDFGDFYVQVAGPHAGVHDLEIDDMPAILQQLFAAADELEKKQNSGVIQ